MVDKTADLIASLVARVRHYHPALSDKDAALLDKALRNEFGGQSAYVRKRPSILGLAWEIRSRFNGRNATQLARELGIGRATVYRVLKRSR